MDFTQLCVVMLIGGCITDVISSDYVVIANDKVLKGSTYGIQLMLTGFTGRVEITARVTYNDDNREEQTLVENTQRFRADDGVQTLELEIPDIWFPNWVYLNVSGSGAISFEHRKSMRQSKSAAIMIQTDKGTYKPGDLVRYRVFIVSPELLPKSGPFNVTIYDNLQNKISQHLNWMSSDEDDVFSEELQLSEQPPLGDWNIRVSMHDEHATKLFTVQEYVLPKYEVKIEMDRPFQAVEYGDIHGTVQAKYTFGQYVDGEAELIVTRDDYRDSIYGTEALGQEQRITKQLQQTSTGRFEFVLTLAELSEWLEGLEGGWRTPELAGYTFRLTAVVTEALTGKMLNTSQSMKVERERLNLEVMSATPDSFKPQLEFKGYVRLSQVNGAIPGRSDLSDGDGTPKTVTVETQLTYERSPRPWYPRDEGPRGAPDGPDGPDTPDWTSSRQTRSTRNEYDIDSLGRATISLNISDDVQELYFRAFYTKEDGSLLTARSNTIMKYTTRDGNFMQLSILSDDPVLRAGESEHFQVTANDNSPLNAYYYVLVNQGVALSGVVSSSGRFSVRMPPTPSPMARIAVVAVTADGELLVDGLVLSVEAQLSNNVTVEFSTEQTRPGQDLTLDITAEPNSFVGILAVDQSVRLLSSGNDITQNQVMSEIASFDNSNVDYNTIEPFYGCMMFVSPSSTDAEQTLEGLGLMVMTNAYIHRNNDYYEYFYRPGFYVYDDFDGGMPMGPPGNEGRPGREGPDGNAGARGPTGADGDDGYAESDEDDTNEVYIRQNFIETWLWTDTVVGDDGSQHIRVTVPDTMTSWSANVIALHPVAGLGIPQTNALLTVFQPFFITLDAPYSIIRSEILNLKVNVFNYADVSQLITVQLYESPHYQVSQTAGDVPSYGELEQDVMVNSGEAAQMVFIIKATSVGEVAFNLHASSDMFVDAISKTIIVKPEGVPHSTTHSYWLDINGEAANYEREIEVDLPQHVVPQSQYIEVSLMGDVMAKLIENIDSLIELPYGCGEQNMINFVPNILVLEYFDHTGYGSADQRASALSNMQIGYQRELTYMHPDGSYSSWGGAGSGSTWLTAFVVRSFQRARQFMDIDESVLQLSVDFLLDHQSEDGAYIENGRVSNSMLKGNSYQGDAFTAYVLEALCRVQEMDGGIERSVGEAKMYLQSRDLVNADTYTLAIATSAFQCLDDSYADVLLEELNNRAIEEDNGKYWPDLENENHEPEYFCHYCHPSFEVEQTAYGLLANLYGGTPNRDILPYIVWLLRQQNSRGGFRSTQDTVIALSAFTEYAERVYSNAEELDLELSVEALGVNSDDVLERHDFDKISQENSLVLQQYQLPAETLRIKLMATGTGVAIFQLTVKSTVSEGEQSPSVMLDLDVVDVDDDHVNLEICARWLDSTQASGISNIDIVPFSGYKAVEDSLNDHSDKLRRVEVVDNQINTYWEEFPSNSNLCMDILMEREFIVEDLQPARVAAYSYYSPGKRSEATYSKPIIEPFRCTLIETSDTTFTSPGWDGKTPYEAFLNKCWLIMAPEGQNIQFEFTDFALEFEDSCRYDSFNIYNAEPYNSNDMLDVVSRSDLVMGLCGQEEATVDVPYRKLLVVFSTDNLPLVHTDTGFNVVVHFVEESESGSIPNPGGCSITTSPTDISSPGWTEGENYDRSIRRCWIIQAPEDMVVQLQFTDFDLEEHDRCSWDYVSVYDGMYTSVGELLAMRCGEEIPHDLVTSSRYMYVLFVSDHVVTKAGFNAEVDFIQPSSNGCILIGSDVTITSQGYDGFTSYRENVTQCWNVAAPTGNVIELEITDLAIEPHGSCAYDSLRIYEGDSADGLLLAVFCGHNLPDENTVSTTNSIYIVFTSDTAVTNVGFSMALRFIADIQS